MQLMYDENKSDWVHILLFISKYENRLLPLKYRLISKYDVPGNR